ncbi:glycosyltransferase family 4 protein [Halomonas sp. A29]|uniref:glycosyltransferase family 4 protein n=1 Tax=Halomonas sp. A29 TaxID=3102786 RepID=UPI00398ADCD0
MNTLIEQKLKYILNKQPAVKKGLLALLKAYELFISRHYEKKLNSSSLSVVVENIERNVRTGNNMHKSNYLAKISLKLTGAALLELKSDLAKRSIDYATTEISLLAYFEAAMARNDLCEALEVYSRCEKERKNSNRFKTLRNKIINSPVGHLTLKDKVKETGVSDVKLDLQNNRLCYILHNSLPYSTGGYATRAQGVAEGFKNNGHEVICITRPGYPLDIESDIDKGHAIPLSDRINDIEFRRILEPSKNKTKSTEYMLEASEKLKQQFAEVKPGFILAASNYMCALPALIAARDLNIPFVYEVRGFWEISKISREPSYKNTLGYKVQEAMETFVANSSDLVFTLTNEMKKELIARGVEAYKIYLLPNCCDPVRFFPRNAGGELRSYFDIPNDVAVIGYIGTFVKYEGLDDLAQACGILSERGLDFRLLLVGSENTSGSGKGPILNDIISIATAKGFVGKLIAPGRVPHDQVEKYYSLIDIAPFPRKPLPVCEMVSPMKPLEAMASGKAVVVSSVSALTEIVIDEETGLVFDKGNIEDLAFKLERLIKDVALRNSIGANSRSWVCKEREWKKVVAEASSLIDKKVLSARPINNVSKY